MSTITKIAESNTVKYLSIIIDSKQKFDRQVKKKLLQRIFELFAESQLLENKEITDYMVFSTRKRLTNTVLNVDNEKNSRIK